jgi:hypothetical protein
MLRFRYTNSIAKRLVLGEQFKKVLEKSLMGPSGIRM